MKIKGIFEKVIPLHPWSGGRKIKIKKHNGESVFLTSHFETLLREEKKVKTGDHVEVDYKDLRNFTMEKI